MDILTQICQTKRAEIQAAKGQLPLGELRSRALDCQPSGRDMKAALAHSRSGIISEFKRRSPSKGWIHENVGPLDVVPAYSKGGASALSILTDQEYFGGCLDYIKVVRPLVDTPILRKDFILDEYQLLEARMIGADAVLLIASCLEINEFEDLLGAAHELGLQVLLEVHTPEELEYVRGGVDMLGVNNRNLGTFHTDVQNSFRIAEAMRQATAGMNDAPVLVSESGISQVETVLQLRDAGFRGFLMGENFMKQDNPGEALAEFVKAVER